LAAERQKMKEEKIELLLIDAGESKAKVKAFIERQQLSFTVLLDVNTLVAESYGVVGVPTFVLISADGDIVWMGNELPDNYRKLLAR
jgi:peroxiredoxin